MKNIVCSVHWTLLVVSVVSCSCLLALVVSCEGTSKSIDGSSPGIAAPTQPPSALPKSEYMVPSSNSANVLEEKSNNANQLFLNGTSTELNTGHGSSITTIDPDSTSHSLHSDDPQPKQISKGIDIVPVAEIHSSFEESVIETKQCITCGQESEEGFKAKTGHPERFGSSSGNGFAETKDANIVERVVVLSLGPEEKQKSKASSNSPEQIPLQLERPPLDSNETVEFISKEIEESPPNDLGNIVISQVLATSEVRESEQLTQVGGVESASPKSPSIYVVRAEPKVVDVKRTDVKPVDSVVHVKPKTEEKDTKEERSGPNVISAESLPQDPMKSASQIKVDGHVVEEPGKAKDEASSSDEQISSEPSSPVVPDTTGEPPASVPSASASEDMPSFSEWTQKRLEEAERQKVQNDTTTQAVGDGSSMAVPHAAGPSGVGSSVVAGAGSSGSSPATGPASSKTSGDGSVGMVNSVPGGPKVRQKNYASPDCGAKIASSNPEAVSPGSVLSPSRDEYLLNACASRIWFVVELCEAIRAKKIELANFELFSSSPREFSVWSSDRFPTRDWSLVGRFSAQDERTLQSFHLDPHLYAKFIRVELHSHYGSEHFCPVSLFRVYGTSEFEVLETEQEDGVNGVIRSGDSSGSLGGEDDGEDSDEEEPLDVETNGPPRNLFGSARDAVMSIVKKAAEALVKAGDSANETITLATQSPIKEVPKNETSEPISDGEETESAFSSQKESAAECRTLRRPPLCHGCEEATILRAAALLSCHYDTLRPLTTSPFVRSALASGGICATRFGLPLSAANPTSSTPATDGGYVSALLPVEYLVALCNALITPDMVRESDPVILPEVPIIQQPSYLGESATQSVALEPHRSTEGTLSGDTATLALKIKPTKTLKDDMAGSKEQDEGILDSGTHEESSPGIITGSSTTEAPQTTSVPRFSSMTSSSSYQEVVEAAFSEEEVVTMSTSERGSMAKQEVLEPHGDILGKDSESSSHESVVAEGLSTTSSMPESTSGLPPSAASLPPPSSISTIPTTNPSSSIPSSQSTHSTSEGLPSQGSAAPGAKGLDDTNSVSTPSIVTGTLPQGSSKIQETTNAASSGAPTAAVIQKESVFVRLSNRIKILERNMSLSAQYLEELSRRYRKQFEEAQKQSIEAQKRDRRLAEDAANLQGRLDVLADAVKGLLEARKREEDEKRKQMEEEEARRREEQEYGENFPWWGAILIWAWNTAGRAMVSVAQHAVIFCVELMVLWAVMGHYQRRHWNWSGVPSSHLETEPHHPVEGDVQQQLKYSSLRKRRKWAGGMKEDDWVESTETGRSPRKRKTTNEDVGLEDGIDAGLPTSEQNVHQPQQKQRRRRRKLKSSSATSLTSFASPVVFPLPPATEPPPLHPAVPITQLFEASHVEDLNGWTWPSGRESVGETHRASVVEEDFVKHVPKDDTVTKAENSEKSIPRNKNGGDNKNGLGKTKPRRVSAPIFFREDSGTLKKNVEESSPLSRSSSQIHSSLRVCSPKLKGDNWEWFTGARVSGDVNSKGSRAVNRNGRGVLPSGDGTYDSDRVDGQAGSASPKPSGSNKSKDKKSSSSGSSGSGGGGGGSSLKRIVKRFF